MTHKTGLFCETCFQRDIGII